jgi:iron complex outermembrane recepter protein
MDYYRIRGFDASYSNTFLDGLLAEGAPFEELWAFERIEVVKGPASTLFGQGPLGGFVNLVSKRPRPDFFGEVQFTGGSFDYYQGAFDINSPFNKDRTIYARLNASFARRARSSISQDPRESLWPRHSPGRSPLRPRSPS